HYYQFDIIIIFINTKIPEGTKIYVQQPTNFETQLGMVYLFKKVLYKFRKIPLWWFEIIHNILKKYRFEPLNIKYYIFKNKTLKVLFIIYMNDMYITSSDKVTINQIKVLLVKFFVLKNIGSVHKFLNMIITRDYEKGLL